MTKRRNSTADRGTRTEAGYAAAAEWAETNIPDVAVQTKNSGEASREAVTNSDSLRRRSPAA